MKLAAGLDVGEERTEVLYPAISDYLKPIHRKHVIGVNNAYLIGSWIDICWFGDCRWYGWHQERLKEFSGLIATCCLNLSSSRVKTVSRGKPRGLEPKRNQVSWNGNSGASAISFAYHLGVKRIVLIGYDMQRVKDQANWHKDHPAPDKNPYPRFMQRFHTIKNDARNLHLEIVNATPNSALDLFPMVRLEDVV